MLEEKSFGLYWRTSRNVVLGLQDIYSLTHFECKGYKYHFWYSSAGQDLRNTGQSTKEFSSHSKFTQKSVWSLNNEVSHLNHEFGFITHWETEAEQNMSANTRTWEPQLASCAEETSQTEVVEMLEVRTDFLAEQTLYGKPLEGLPALAFRPAHQFHF